MLRLHCRLLQSAHKISAKNMLTNKASTSSSNNSTWEKHKAQSKQPMEAATPFADIKITVPAGKQPARAPLIKNFFLGLVDKELLAYPEVIPRENYSKLQNEVQPLKHFFDEQEHADIIEKLRTQPTELLQQLQALGLYGLNVPDAYDGKDYGWSESLIASEQEVKCTDVALTLLSHRVVIDVLKDLGSQQQQKLYLSKLANGSLVGAEAIFESEVPEKTFFNTSALYSADSNTWTLNGAKSYVITGPVLPNANQLFLVIANTERPNMQGDGKNASTAFLVESTAAGVQLGEQQQTIGCQGVHMRQVKFEQVHLTADNLLGTFNNGNAVAELLIRSSRLRQSLLALGMCKSLLKELTEHFVNHKQSGVQLIDLEVAKGHLSKAVCSAYAIESMIYMSAGLLDEFYQQDVLLEAAVTKYFSMKQLFKFSSKSLDIFGARSLQARENTEVTFRNATQLYTYGESMDMLSLSIAVLGLQHAGLTMRETVQKSRNPLFNPGHIFERFLQTANIDNPKTKMQLGEHLHPSLEPAAQCIEHSVARLQMAVETLFTRYGNTIVERHLDLQRLTEIVTLIYAMYASTARASRSYCIGLYLADHELLTASTIVSYGRDRVKTLCLEIFGGPYISNDKNLMRMSKQIAKSKGYFPVHPLTFNF